MLRKNYLVFLYGQASSSFDSRSNFLLREVFCVVCLLFADRQAPVLTPILISFCGKFLHCLLFAVRQAPVLTPCLISSCGKFPRFACSLQTSKLQFWLLVQLLSLASPLHRSFALCGHAILTPSPNLGAGRRVVVHCAANWWVLGLLPAPRPGLHLGLWWMAVLSCVECGHHTFAVSILVHVC